MKSKREITVNVFDIKKTLRIHLVGNSDRDKGLQKQENGLTTEETELINWLLTEIDLNDYKEHIAKYCTKEYSKWGGAEIIAEEIPTEVDFKDIYINVRANESDYYYNNKLFYYDIAISGECKNGDGHGIIIGFYRRQFLGINSGDWGL